MGSGGDIYVPVTAFRRHASPYVNFFAHFFSHFPNHFSSLSQTLFLLLCLTLLQGCGTEPEIRILSQDESALLQFQQPTIRHNVRKGPELGFEVTMEVDGFDRISGRFYVRCALLDSTGNMVLSTLQETRTDTVDGQPVLNLVPKPVIAFGAPDSTLPPIVQLYFPYHWLPVGEGNHSFQLDFTAVAGLMHVSTARGGHVTHEEKMQEAGKMLAETRLPVPELAAVRVRIPYIEMNIDEFNPHDMDFSLGFGRRHGFPDLYWAVGVGYERVYKSTYFRNAVTGRWPDPSDVIYVSGPEEKISLCVVDWDDQRILNNRHDEIACWEGQLKDLSTDGKKPSLLKFPRVRRMEVAVEWMENLVPETKGYKKRPGPW
ncbi:MAG: hypothetical protein AAF570_17235 [Bacteroidota bacterium]